VLIDEQRVAYFSMCFVIFKTDKLSYTFGIAFSLT